MTEVLLIVDVDPREVRHLDPWTEELSADLREIGGVAVRAARAAQAQGDKSAIAIAIGQLVVSGAFGSVAVRQFAQVIVQFLHRHRADSVTVRKGDKEVVIERPSDGQVDALVEQLRDLLSDG